MWRGLGEGWSRNLGLADGKIITFRMDKTTRSYYIAIRNYIQSPGIKPNNRDYKKESIHV